jgi:A/G-specific adenine glycosylase
MPNSTEQIQRIGTIRSGLLEWGTTHLRKFPWRNEGNRTPYRILVAELLLKRTTAQAASKIYEQFLMRFPDLSAIASSSEAELERVLTSVGLQRQRAKGFKAMTHFLIERCGGVVPCDLDQLKEIPHVGEYSARAVMTFAHGMPAAVVDSNVVRVLGRLFSKELGRNPTLARYQELADSVLPFEDHREFNWGILDLGALVCRYDRPKCEVCPFGSICDSSRLAGTEKAN